MSALVELSRHGPVALIALRRELGILPSSGETGGLLIERLAYALLAQTDRR